jgi:hypothetical protein
MSCDVDKFTITSGVDNTFVFTIKADGSTLPMVLDAGDTFTALLKDLESGTTVLTKNLTLPVDSGDYASGKVSLFITAVEADALTGDKGGKADRYYARPTHKLVIDCSTDANGVFLAKIPEIYVD